MSERGRMQGLAPSGRRFVVAPKKEMAIVQSPGPRVCIRRLFTAAPSVICSPAPPRWQPATRCQIAANVQLMSHLIAR